MALAIPTLLAPVLVLLGGVIGLTGYRMYQRTLWLMGALTGVATWLVFIYLSPLITNMVVQGVLLLLSIAVWIKLARLVHNAVIAVWGGGAAILLTYILLGIPFTDPFNPTTILIGIIAGFMAVKLHGLAVTVITAGLGGLGVAAGGLQLWMGGLPTGTLILTAAVVTLVCFVVQARRYRRATGRSIWAAAHPLS